MNMRILSDTFSRAGRLLEVCTVLGFAAGTTAYAQDCFDDTDLQLVNGSIHTMDADFSVVSAVRIANKRFVNVGDSAPGPCTRVIDLNGRTVIPGLIDNHIHLLLPASDRATKRALSRMHGISPKFRMRFVHEPPLSRRVSSLRQSVVSRRGN